MNNYLKIILIMCFGVQVCFSQGGCGCDYFIPVEQNGFDADGVSPGQVICLEAGFRIGFKLINVNGSNTRPIIIKNCGGDVLIGEEFFSFGFNISRSKHFRLTGTGEGADEFGIKIQGSKIAGLTISQKTTKFEVDHIKITGVYGNPAIRIGDDPNCSLTFNEGFFEMEDCYLHHILVNDCSQGFQIGHPLFRIGVSDPLCGILYPHNLENVTISDCEFENITSGDAIQCFGTEGRIENNKLVNIVGHGMNFGTDSKIDVESNEILTTSKCGIYTKGCGEYDLTNNLFLNNGTFKGGAIFIDFDLPIGYPSIRHLNFRHNTVVNSGGFNLKIDQAFLANEPSYVENNMFCEPNPLAVSPYEGAPYIYKSPATEFYFNNNIYSDSRYDEGFVNPDEGNYRLTHSAASVNGGVESNIEWDIEDGHRDLAGAPDIGAYEYVPEPIAYFEAIDLVGLYVDDFKNILGDVDAETELLEFALLEGFNYLVLYNLAYIHSYDYDLTDPSEAIVLANFIERAKHDYGIVQVGGVGEKNASFDKIEEYNALYEDNWLQKIDVLNLEFEFWANEASDVFEYYCETYLTPSGYDCTNEGFFEFYIDQLELIDIRAHEMGIISEIYVGQFSESEGIILGENCDRILLHYYRTSDVYGDGNSIYNYNSKRIKAIALSVRKPAVMPIFSNRPYHMGHWLLLNDMDQVMETWLHGVDAYDDDDSEGVQDLNIAGHQWYRYTSFPRVDEVFYSPVNDEYEDASESGITMYSDVKSKNIVILDSSFEQDDFKTIQLFTLQGESLATQSIQKGTNYFEMEAFTPGIYICSVISGNQIIETTKIVYQ